MFALTNEQKYTFIQIKCLKRLKILSLSVYFCHFRKKNEFAKLFASY